MKKIDSDYPQPADGAPDVLDMETRNSVLFSTGFFNLVCSLMPPKLLRVVSFLGFPADKAVGLAKLRKVFASGSVRQPLAGLALLLHHVFIVSSVTSGAHPYMAETESILAQCEKLYPGLLG